MRHVHLAALVMVVAAAGCYSDAAPESTFPEPGPVPHQVSGPPGAATDPTFVAPYARPYDPPPPYGSPYAPPYSVDPRAQPPDAADDGNAADDAAAAAPNSPDPDDDSDTDDVAQAAPPDGTGVPGAPPADLPPGVSGDPDGEPGVGPGTSPGIDPGTDPGTGPGAGIAQVDPTGGVSDQEIDATLDGYGQWIDTDDYGQVWRPDATVVGVDFTPYESGGSWAYTDAGWAFACDYPWGWLPFHYGRWAWFHGYWGWVPGHRWGPAWVEWRHGGGVVGWRPIRPHPRGPGDGPGHRWHGGDAPFRDHRHAEQHSSHWRFATTTDFARPHIRSHLFGNPAEGLRVTTRVTAPPIRGAATLHAADLMRNRFAAGGRLAQPGRVGTFHPSQPRAPVQGFPPRGPVQSFQSSPQTARPPAYTSPGQPGRTYQPPVRTYQPQGYRPPMYQPRQPRQPGQPGQPAQSGRFYQPAPGQAAQPGRPNQPPIRTYQPPQGYRPPIYQPGPGQTAQPGRPFQPPVYHPPPAFQPHPSPAPVAPPHTWTPPAHASAPPPAVSHPSPPSAPSSSSAPAVHHRP